MLIVSTTGATNINDEHQATDDGVFDVPAELGESLLAFPGWRYATEDEAAAFESASTSTKKTSRTRKS